MKPQLNGRMFSLVYSFLAIFLSLIVLFVSVSRASLTIWAQETKEDDIGGELITFELINKDGSRESGSYKLPEANTLPGTPFYGFRRVRDWLWLVFSRGDLNRAKTSLLLADKKMAEAKELSKDSLKARLMIECGQEALEKLQYSDQLISQTKELNDEWKQLHKQVYSAGLAYYEVLDDNKDMAGEEKENFNKIIEKLFTWNEKQRKDHEEIEL